MAAWADIAAWSAASVWTCMALLPWQPWRNREVLNAAPDIVDDLSDVTVVIPARNEADNIADTLQALSAQGAGLNVVLVDDNSDDSTAEIARRVSGLNLNVIQGSALPDGWSGKLWALEQGRQQVQTPYTLLLDADILLHPGLITALRAKMRNDGIQFASLMASLRMATFWEKLLMPAFIYFFKQLYPFALSNHPRVPYVAAAAGGCIMLGTPLLNELGGFDAIRGALIDDCSLAAQIKARGHRTWIGLSRDVLSVRRYPALADTWDMVARTAYTQLRYSPLLLLFCTLAMLLLFIGPVLGLCLGGNAAWLWAYSMAVMVGLYWPTLRFYSLNPLWAFTMPAIAALYLTMTWSSALRYQRGQRSLWKGRVYTR